MRSFKISVTQKHGRRFSFFCRFFMAFTSPPCDFFQVQTGPTVRPVIGLDRAD